MPQLKVAYITNSDADSGVGYRAESVTELLVKKRIELDRWHLDGVRRELKHNNQTTAALSAWPSQLGSKSVAWIRLGRVFKKQWRGGPDDILHLTNQSLSFLAFRRARSIITVHDIIEILEPQSGAGGWLARYLYRGIRRAAHLICVSEYTANTVREHFGIDAKNITVIPNGVGPEFFPIEDLQNTIGYQTWHRALKIMPGTKIVLYVGSEHPRKNIAAALKSFAIYHRQEPNSIFVKAGAAGVTQGRRDMFELIDRLNLRADFRLLEKVPVGELNELYNFAGVLIYPSRFEGFGLPPLQAMAAGTPVITSNATSLPEVVGDAGIMCGPDDIDGLAAALGRILSDPAYASSLERAGLKRAKIFSWSAAAAAEADVYRKVLAL